MNGTASAGSGDESRELWEAVHRLLLLRLKGQLDSVEGLVAWNDLIDAHDAAVSDEA